MPENFLTIQTPKGLEPSFGLAGPDSAVKSAWDKLRVAQELMRGPEYSHNLAAAEIVDEMLFDVSNVLRILCLSIACCEREAEAAVDG